MKNRPISKLDFKRELILQLSPKDLAQFPTKKDLAQ
jgi:hypothetical protein